MRAQVADTSAAVALRAFLESGARLELDAAPAPRVSILLVLFNRADLTFQCLQSILAHVRCPYEIVIVDNASSDTTPLLLERSRGARILRSGHNLGFLAAANAAAQVAGGEYLLFLNNDTEVLPGALESALRTIEGEKGVGAVGGRLILPDGTLQEAGGIVWHDGSCTGYGRGDAPSHPTYSFRRPVDFCSAAFLLTPRELFHSLGGFDEAYGPAYYEDVDYCVRLWKAGRRVVYDPDAVVLHHEFGSSSSAAARAMQSERRAVFVRQHAGWLASQPRAGDDGELRARDHRTSGRRILVFDDRAPAPEAGFGFPRSADLLEALVELGHFVTLYPTAVPGGAPAAGRSRLPPTIEVLDGYSPRQISGFMDQRRGYYDCVLVSRSHNLKLLRSKLGSPQGWPTRAVIYDAEAITAHREAGRLRLLGEHLDDDRMTRMVKEEVALAQGVHTVVAVSPSERDEFRRHGIANVRIVSFGFQPDPTPRAFDERSGLLFVGSFDDLSPNADAVQWFVEDVLPRVRMGLAEPVRLTVVGNNAPPALLRLREHGVDICPNVDDLKPFYDRARVFVAPTRFAAGIPYKVGHAAAHGVPVVCTSLLAEQLRWRNGEHLLAADTPSGFAEACLRVYARAEQWHTMRRNALERVTSEYSVSTFTEGVRAVLDELPGHSPTGRMSVPRAADCLATR